MKNTDFEELLEIRLMRELRPDEQVRLERWLTAHPADRLRWDEEEILNGVLAELPDAEVPSNFTARVWDRIETDIAPDRDSFALLSGMTAWRRLLPRLAWAGVTVSMVALLWRQEAVRERAKTAESLVPVAEVAQLPSVAVLRDFDAIRSLGEPMVGGDLELLAVLEGLK